LISGKPQQLTIKENLQLHFDNSDGQTGGKGDTQRSDENPDCSRILPLREANYYGTHQQSQDARICTLVDGLKVDGGAPLARATL
jgi:hypothetical protein